MIIASLATHTGTPTSAQVCRTRCATVSQYKFEKQVCAQWAVHPVCHLRTRLSPVIRQPCRSAQPAATGRDQAGDQPGHHARTPLHRIE